MKAYDHIVIGFGKGGKTLAGALAATGETVALIEKSEKMYGGTCINVACIPTKYLENQAKLSSQIGGSFEEKAKWYSEAIYGKRALTSMLREKNYQKTVSSNVEVVTGTAEFLDAHRIIIRNSKQSEQELYGEKFYINTGALPIVPKIKGLKESLHVYTSDTLMELDVLPQNLVIIGGGYIGLEFASYYNNFGSKVTVLQDSKSFMPKEDQEIAETVYENLCKRGIDILFEAQVEQISDIDNQAVLAVKKDGKVMNMTAQAVLVATGRKPNVQELHLEKAGVQLTKRGAIAVDEKLRTSVSHIWAMGDVTGGMQFTYMSLDDSRIVASQIMGDGNRTTENRGIVPYSIFLDPPVSRVGMTEEEAKAKGYSIKTGHLLTTAIPKAQVIRNTTGMMKVIVDANNEQILGAHLFVPESHEIINLIKLAMDEKISYKKLRDSIYNHPTISEAFNDLFATIH